jgi:uncharacterized membrane protein (DUF485 family)
MKDLKTIIVILLFIFIPYYIGMILSNSFGWKETPIFGDWITGLFSIVTVIIIIVLYFRLRDIINNKQ